MAFTPLQEAAWVILWLNHQAAASMTSKAIPPAIVLKICAGARVVSLDILIICFAIPDRVNYTPRKVSRYPV